MSVYARSRCASWFHPLTLYLAFHGLVFVFRPWLGYFYRYHFIYDLYKFQPSQYDKITTIIIVNLGLIAFSAAALRFGNAPMRFPAPGSRARQKNQQLGPFVLVFLAFAPFAIYSIYTMWIDRAAGGLTYQFDSRTGVTINAEGNGYIKEAQVALISLTCIFAWLNRFRLLALAPLAAFVFFRSGTGGRGPIVMTLFALGCYYLFEQRRLWVNARTLAAVAVAAILFGAIADDRGRAIRNLFIDDYSSVYRTDEQKAPLEGMDLGNMEYVEYLVYAVPQRTGTYEFFVDQLQIFTEPIPRELWPDKPVGQPIRYFDLYRYGTPFGMTRSLPGEGWTQLGYAGVILWCGLWGMILGLLYNVFARSRQTVFQTAAYFSLLPILIIFYRDGLLLTVLRLSAFIFSPIALWWIVGRFLSSEPRAGTRRGSPTPRAVRSGGSGRPEPLRGETSGLVPRAWRNRAMGPGE